MGNVLLPSNHGVLTMNAINKLACLSAKEVADTMAALDAARKWEGANSSSAFCYNEALKQWYRDRYDLALSWAVKSLKHSVGIFHPDYKAAAALLPRQPDRSGAYADTCQNV